MKSYTEYINDLLGEEMPIAVLEDWFFSESDDLGTISSYVIENKWTLLETFNFTNKFKKVFELRQCRNTLLFILGYNDIDYEYTEQPMERFKIIFRLDCSRMKTLDRYFDVDKLIKVNTVAVLSGYQGNGIAKMVYKYLVTNLGYSILSDGTQYNGARKLWNRLSNEIESIVVDVVDLDTKKVLVNNVQLNHGYKLEDINTDYWSLDKSKENIRFILKNIK